MRNENTAAMDALRASIDNYHPIKQQTWSLLTQGCRVYGVKKQQTIYPIGEIPTSFSFVVKGLIRCYAIDENGNEYNKNFFDEGKYPGAMASMLTHTPSNLGFESIEDTQLVEIDFPAYRKLMYQSEDLMRFQIAYLEQNWLLAKDTRELEIVQQEASQRYIRFRQQHPKLANRLPQYHIASHLGITPTQLSRIRKHL